MTIESVKVTFGGLTTTSCVAFQCASVTPRLASSAGTLLRVRRLRDPLLHLRDLARQALGERPVGALLQHVRQVHPADVLVADNLDLVAEDLVPVRVVEVVVRVEDVLDRLRGQFFLDLRDEGPRRRRRDARVDEHRVVGVDDDEPVAHRGHRARAGREVHAVRELLEPVGLACRRRAPLPGRRVRGPPAERVGRAKHHQHDGREEIASHGVLASI